MFNLLILQAEIIAEEKKYLKDKFLPKSGDSNMPGLIGKSNYEISHIRVILLFFINLILFSILHSNEIVISGLQLLLYVIIFPILLLIYSFISAIADIYDIFSMVYCIISAFIFENADSISLKHWHTLSIISLYLINIQFIIIHIHAIFLKHPIYYHFDFSFLSNIDFSFLSNIWNKLKSPNNNKNNKSVNINYQKSIWENIYIKIYLKKSKEFLARRKASNAILHFKLAIFFRKLLWEKIRKNKNNENVSEHFYLDNDIDCLLGIGAGYYIKSKYLKAYRYFLKVLDIFHRLKKNNVNKDGNIYWGVAYYFLNDFNNSVQEYFNDPLSNRYLDIDHPADSLEIGMMPYILFKNKEYNKALYIIEDKILEWLRKRYLKWFKWEWCVSQSLLLKSVINVVLNRSLEGIQALIELFKYIENKEGKSSSIWVHDITMGSFEAYKGYNFIYLDCIFMFEIISQLIINPSKDIMKYKKINKKVIEKYPDYCLWNLALGINYLMKQEYAQAIKVLRKSIKDKNRVTLSYKYLAYAYFESNNLNKAKKYIRKYLLLQQQYFMFYNIKAESIKLLNKKNISEQLKINNIVIDCGNALLQKHYHPLLLRELIGYICGLVYK